MCQSPKKVADSFGGDLGHTSFCLEVEQRFQVLPLPVFFQAKRCGLTCSYSPLFFFFPDGKMERRRMEMGE